MQPQRGDKGKRRAAGNTPRSSPPRGGSGKAAPSRSASGVYPFFRNDVIILAGGFGRRLAGALGGLPKPMVEVAGRPFLEWVLLYLRRFGFLSFVFSFLQRHLKAVLYSHGNASHEEVDVRRSVRRAEFNSLP